MEKLTLESAFVQQYLATALWSTTDGSGESLDEICEISDFAPAAVMQALRDCESFLEQAGELLNGIDAGQAGHDFWLTRERHGAGFWDRGLGDVGQKLTDIAHGFGEGGLYLGDDEQLYFN